ncbi:hypothetical protein ADIMK_2621 [Marinobacterium lacunae]|uniref:Uncharacterized protein n=1 Tax=Marinobacterium lacunae TaxID=1232683 RepID=A0A081FX42_9GAMM|nr:hypothetical protein ADIMK_2621 [Marinobacterium lacunae]
MKVMYQLQGPDMGDRQLYANVTIRFAHGALVSMQQAM